MHRHPNQTLSHHGSHRSLLRRRHVLRRGHALRLPSMPSGDLLAQRGPDRVHPMPSSKYLLDHKQCRDLHELPRRLWDPPVHRAVRGPQPGNLSSRHLRVIRHLLRVSGGEVLVDCGGCFLHGLPRKYRKFGGGFSMRPQSWIFLYSVIRDYIWLWHIQQGHDPWHLSAVHPLHSWNLHRHVWAGHHCPGAGRGRRWGRRLQGLWGRRGRSCDFLIIHIHLRDPVHSECGGWWD